MAKTTLVRRIDEGKSAIFFFFFFSFSLQFIFSNLATSFGLIFIQNITIREAKRNNPAYRPHGLTALGGVAQARKDLNLTAEAISIVSNVLDDIDDSGDPMDIDSGSGPGAKQTLENTLAACVKCLLQCLSPAVQAAQTLSEGEKTLSLRSAIPCVGELIKEIML